MAKSTKKLGRPSLYTEELGKQICARIAAGESLKTICAEPGMPDVSTVLRWQDDEAFRVIYVRAREAHSDLMAEEILEIADDATGDMSEDEDGKQVVNHEHINRARLRVDTRKWLMAKLHGRRYGDKIQQEHSGSLTLEALVEQSIKPKQTP